MPESAEEYIKRISGYVGDRDPLDVIAKTPRHLSETIHSVTASALDYRPEPRKWNVREQVAHLVDAELVMTTRMRWAAAEPGKRIAGFDQDAWAVVGKYAALPIEMSLTSFAAARTWTVEWLHRLAPNEREGWIHHEERGRETLGQLVRVMAGHDLNHLLQIRRLLAACTSQGNAVPVPAK